MKKVLILTGPTASGKSARSIEWAHHHNGVIINGDSMQLYTHLPILTACPTDKDKSQIPHYLYQILGDNQIGSAGWWVDQAHKVIWDAFETGKTPIIVGGTGLYLQALTQGLSPIPEISDEIRQKARELATNSQSPEEFYEYVCDIDPMIQGILNVSDNQRLTRALEVKLSTGRSLIDWQKEPRLPSPFHFHKMMICISREELYSRINNRFLTMIETGAIEEVKDLLNRPIRPDSPILRAVGVKAIQDFIEGNLTRIQMIELGQQATRQYAKRQLTWLKTQAQDYITI